jgi:transcriptional regulator with XRE-family HTH domain
MYALTKKQKLEFILEKVKEMELTAYDIGRKTKLSVSGIEKILNKTSKNPHEITLNKIITYLESLVLGTNLKENNSNNLVNEETEVYKLSEELKNKIHNDPLYKCLNEKILLTQEIVKLQSILYKNNIKFKNIFEEE